MTVPFRPFSRPSFDEWLHDYDGGAIDRSLWFVAEDEQGIAGFLLGQPALAEDTESGYVSELGVRPGRRGEGLGLALLLHAFEHFRRRGRRRVALHVDGDNVAGATRLYERAGMRAEPRITVWEREFRPAAKTC